MCIAVFSGDLRGHWDMTKEEARATELSPLPHAFAHLQCWPRLEETMSLCMSNDKYCECNMSDGCFSIKQKHVKFLPQECPPKFSFNSVIVKVWRLEQWHKSPFGVRPSTSPRADSNGPALWHPHWSRPAPLFFMVEAVSVTIGITEKNRCISKLNCWLVVYLPLRKI